jgi:hypothetical protein
MTDEELEKLLRQRDQMAGQIKRLEEESRQQRIVLNEIKDAKGWLVKMREAAIADHQTITQQMLAVAKMETPDGVKRLAERLSSTNERLGEVENESGRNLENINDLWTGLKQSNARVTKLVKAKAPPPAPKETPISVESVVRIVEALRGDNR